MTKNPAAQVATRLVDLSGHHCYAVGPVIFGVTRARVTLSGSRMTGYQALVEISSTANGALDRYAAGHLGQTLAVVMFGTVVEAAPIESKSYNGVMAVTGLTKSQAHRIAAALG